MVLRYTTLVLPLRLCIGPAREAGLSTGTWRGHIRKKKKKNLFVNIWNIAIICTILPTLLLTSLLYIDMYLLYSQQQLSYRQQIARQLRTQYVEGINSNSVTLKCRSLKVIETDTIRKHGCCFLFTLHGAVLYRLRHIATYWSKNPKFLLYTPPNPVFSVPVRGDPVGISRRYLILHKIRMIVLPCCEETMTTC